MARTFTDDEREKLLSSIKEYVLRKIKNNESFSGRDVAKHFPITNPTASKYLNELAKTDARIKEVLEKNKPKTVNDEEVRIRIDSVVKLLLVEDCTVEEIAKRLNVSQNTVYEDLQTRLVKMDYSKDILDLVKNKLIEHSRRNLNNQVQGTKPKH